MLFKNSYCCQYNILITKMEEDIKTGNNFEHNEWNLGIIKAF